MNVHEMSNFVRVEDLITNRVSNINFMLGFGRDGMSDNPVRIRRKRGINSVTVYGCEVASWHVWDMPGIENAFQRVSAVSDALWALGRCGAIKPEYRPTAAIQALSYA